MMIGHLMSTCVVTASPMQSLKSAAKIMEENDFDALPICDNHRVIGMLTVRDIAMKAVAQGLSLAESKISEFMTFETAYVFTDRPAEEVVRLMIEQQLRRLLVLDRDYQLVGIVSVDDLLMAGNLQAILASHVEATKHLEAYQWPNLSFTSRKQPLH
jgi:CBS domain-containing protein